MLAYREKAGANRDDEPLPDAGATSSDSGKIPGYMSLAKQYGLHDDMDIGDSGGHEQTIEQEYQAYVTAQLSPKNVDILKFWEVSGDINDASILLKGRWR
jgi:hypothetical protein